MQRKWWPTVATQHTGLRVLPTAVLPTAGVVQGDSWWRHRMETFSASLARCEGNPQVTGEFPSQRPLTRNFDVFFDLRLNKRPRIQLRRLWFETPARSLWRHCNEPIPLGGIWLLSLTMIVSHDYCTNLVYAMMLLYWIKWSRHWFNPLMPHICLNELGYHWST